MTRGLFALLLAALSVPALAGIEVTDARTGTPLPGTDVMAGYLTARNTGDRTVAITGASSAAFRDVELHRSMNNDGISTMKPVPRLVVPPGRAAILAPGGYHLMMFTPAPRPSRGDTLDLVLHTDQGDVPVSMQVVDRAQLIPADD